MNIQFNQCYDFHAYWSVEYEERTKQIKKRVNDEWKSHIFRKIKRDDVSFEKFVQLRHFEQQTVVQCRMWKYISEAQSTDLIKLQGKHA